MLFCYFGKSYQVLKNSYLLNQKIGFGCFSTIKIDNKLSPCTPSAIDLSKYNVYKKIYQEFLERYRIACNMNNYSKIESFNPLMKKVIKNNRHVIGYLYNNEYGFMDTTGTASGIYSKRLKEKALLELIEKNEAMLIWYLEKGCKIIINQQIKDLINSIGFYSEEIYIFSSSNLCNLNTFLIILFHNEKVIATGVSIDKDSSKALYKSLLEAKLIEALYMDENISSYNKFTKNDYEIIYKYVKYLSNNMGNVYFKKDIKQEIILASWINSIEFAILNTKLNQEFITLRCFSKQLLNCIPNKEYIIKCINKDIFTEYNVNKNYIVDKPDSIIV